MQASDQPESPRTLLLCRRLLPGAFARSSWPIQAPQGVAPGRRSWWPFLLQTCLLLAPSTGCRCSCNRTPIAGLLLGLIIITKVPWSPG